MTKRQLERRAAALCRQASRLTEKIEDTAREARQRYPQDRQLGYQCVVSEIKARGLVEWLGYLRLSIQLPENS